MKRFKLLISLFASFMFIVSTVNAQETPPANCGANQVDILGTCTDISHPGAGDFTGNWVEPTMTDTGPSFDKLSSCGTFTSTGVTIQDFLNKDDTTSSTSNETYTYDATSGEITFAGNDGSETFEVHYQPNMTVGTITSDTLFFIKGGEIDFAVVRENNDLTCDTSKLVYTDDYQNSPDDNYQGSFSYQITGDINLTSDVISSSDNVRVSLQQIGSDNFWNAIDIPKDATGSLFSLGANAGQYVLRLEIDGAEHNEYVYDANSSKWIPQKNLDLDPIDPVSGVIVDDEDPNFDFDTMYQAWVPVGIGYLDVDSNISGISFDMAALEASSYKVNFSVVLPGVLGTDFNIGEFCSQEGIFNTSTGMPASPTDVNISDVSICEWAAGGTTGYNWWIGENGVKVEVLDATNGQFITEKKILASNGISDSTNTTFSGTIKLPKYGEYIFRVTKQTFDQTTSFTNWESYYFNPTNGKLIDESQVMWKEGNSTDMWGNTLWIPDVTQTGKYTINEVTDEKLANDSTARTSTLGSTIDFVALEDSIIKLTGSVNFDTDTNSVNLDLINLQNGNWFGHQEFNQAGNYEIKLPGEGKYLLRVSRETSDGMWESYLVDLSNPDTPKFIPEYNVMWKDYIQDADGNLTAVDTMTDFDWSVPTLWIPDLSQVTPLTVLGDTTTPAPIDINFEAMDDQFYIVEGNVTVPADFIPGDVMGNSGNWLGYNNVDFEVTDATNGDWITWQEIKKDLVATNTDGTKVYAYKLKLPQAGEYNIKVNYETFDKSTSMSEWSGYFVDFANGTLISDTKVPQIPVLDETQYLPDYTSDMCWNEGKFWWDDPAAYEKYQQSLDANGTTLVSGGALAKILEPNDFGKCYSEQPMNWKPDFDGAVTLNDTTKIVSKNLDFVAIENNAYKLSGTISGLGDFIPNHDWENLSNIRIEATDANTGAWLGDGHIQFDDNAVAKGSYNYSFKLDGVESGTNIIVKIVKEQNKNNNWEQESYFLNPGDDGVLGTSDDSFVSEDQVQWIEKDVAGQSWTMWVPDVTQTGFITLGTPKSITIDVNYGQGESSYETNKLALSGTITLSEAVKLGNNNGWWNSIRVEAIKKSTGEWMGSTEATCDDENGCTALAYELVFQEKGDYIIQITKDINGESENYFYNFGDDYSVSGISTAQDKLINGQNIEWKEATQKVNSADMWKNWMPDFEKTGFINFQAKTTLDIDFTTFESSLMTISGKITIPEDFNIGEYCTNSDDVVGICEWSGGNRGFNEWYGNKNIRVEALNKDNGKWLGSVDVKRKIENTNQYEFKLKLGDASEVGNKFIIKITKEENGLDNWKSDEVYYNFGTDHAIDGADDKLVNGKKVEWIEASTAEDANMMWKNWMPNPDTTGWIETDTSVTDLEIDLSTLGANDYYISGTVSFKEDFNLLNENSYADLSIIDASNGMWVGNTPINKDGSFELNIGEESGEFILQINYSFNDYNNWENSWSKNKFYDFGTDKTYGTDDEILNDSDVQWQPIVTSDMLKDTITDSSQCWQGGYFWSDEEQSCYDQPMNWIPNVNPITIDDTVVTIENNKKRLSGVDIDLSVTTGKTLNIAIANIPSSAQNAYVFVVNPLSYGGSRMDLKLGDSGEYTATISELKSADYTVEFGYDVDDKHEHFFVKDSDNDLSNGVGTVPDFEVNWEELDSNTQMWGPSATDTTYINMAQDLNLSIAIVVPDYNELNATVSGLDSNKEINVDFRSLDNPYSKYEMMTSDSNGDISFNFDDVKNGNYILSFSYDGNEYTYDQDTKTLKKDVMWVAFNSNDTQVCPTGANNDNWNCDWTNSYDWQWRPDITPLNFTDNDKALNLAMPTALKVSANIDLSDDFAGKNINVSVFQNNGNDWNWKDFSLDENGDANESIKVNGGDDYRIELWVDGLGGYAYTTNGWITQNNSWSENTTNHMWEPNAETLIDINANLNLGTVTIGSDFKTVTVTVENLDTDDGGNIEEDVWVSLESGTQGNYGDGNANWGEQLVTYDNNVTFKVPAANDYKLLVFPMNHNGGYANDESGAVNAITTATALNWNEMDTIDVTNSTVVTVTLPSAATLGEINGTVICDENNASADCSGWIDASGTNNGQGAPVNADGTFEIKGLNAGDYEVNYWANDGMMLNQHSVTVTSGAITPLTLEVAATTMLSINGTVGDESTWDGKEVVLLLVTNNKWEVISSTAIGNYGGSFGFGQMPEPTNGATYMVAVIEKSYDTVTYASTVSFSKAVDVIQGSGVTIPTSFSATLNNTITLGK